MRHLDDGPESLDKEGGTDHSAASQEIQHGPVRSQAEVLDPQLTPKLGMIAKGVAMGVAASAITQTGQKIVAASIKNPLVVFSLGFASGFLLHKYRREIIATANSSAEHGKEFVLRQKANLEDLLH